MLVRLYKNIGTLNVTVVWITILHYFHAYFYQCVSLHIYYAQMYAPQWRLTNKYQLAAILNQRVQQKKEKNCLDD